MTQEWVFAGSVWLPGGKRQAPFYAANSGDVICLSNFESAMLDLPISSPKDNAELVFERSRSAFPPLETPVQVILEPILTPKTEVIRLMDRATRYRRRWSSPPQVPADRCGPSWLLPMYTVQGPLGPRRRALSDLV